MSRTNVIYPPCYARALGDCSGKLSREHYISASILELLGDSHTITNASWLASGQQSDQLPTSALGSKILCQRHNASLSPLDEHAKVFFTELLTALSDDEEVPHSPGFRGKRSASEGEGRSRLDFPLIHDV